MSSASPSGRPGPGAENHDQAPEEVADRLAELLPKGALRTRLSRAFARRS